MRRRDARDEGFRLTELILVVNEPFAWPGPLRLSSDRSPTWIGWAALAAFALYGGVGAGIDGDAGWSAGLLLLAVLAGLLAWRLRREGVWVDAEGLTARELFSATRVPWSDAVDILARNRAGRSQTWVERADGRLLLLPHVSGKEPVIDDDGLRYDLLLLACWWQAGRRRAGTPPG